MYNINPTLKYIEVDFDSSVNTSSFNQNSYNQITNSGLELNEISLIHYASIHYQSKFNNSLARRFKYTLDTIEPSLVNPTSGKFYFSGNEESELQRITSEVIGVGFALSLMHRLLDVKFNNFNRIPISGRGKRCDFEIIKDGERFIIEAKGRKTNINGAKDEIHAQKNSYPDLVKYGVVSHIPRNGEPSRLFVTDPEVELPPADRDYKIISILNHYSKIARLGGFYRLSEKLNDRIDDIIEAKGVTGQFNHVSLDYGNVFKLGRAIEFSFPDMAFSSFFSTNMEVGFKTILKNNKMLVFGMDRKVIELLEGQDYDGLLEYEFRNIHGDEYSILDNGTFLIRTDSEAIYKLL